MKYFKHILQHIDRTGNLSIKLSEMIDISTETTKALENAGIDTLKQLSEMEIDKIISIPNININNITEFFSKLSNYTYYSDGEYRLNSKARIYLEKIQPQEVVV